TGFPDSRLLLFVESRVANGVVRTVAVVQSFHFPTWRFADETSLLVKDLWDPHRTFWHFRTIFLVNRSRHNYIDRFRLVEMDLDPGASFSWGCRNYSDRRISSYCLIFPPFFTDFLDPYPL